MTEKEFREVVAIRGRELPERARQVAIECILRDAGGTPQRADIGRCIETAGIIAAEYQTSNETGKSTTSLSFDTTPDIHLRSQMLTAVIQPRVEKMRLTLFRSPHPPFSSYAKAVQWIEREARKQPARLPIFGNEQVKALHREINEKQRALTHLLGVSVGLSWTARYIPFAKDRRQQQVQVWEGHLVTLEKNSRQLAQWTGFSQLSLVAHILAGEPLLLPTWRYSIRLPDFEDVSRFQVSIQFPSMQDVSVDHMKALYRKIRKTLGLSRAKKFSPRDELLLTIVNKAGGVPQSDKTVFWEKIRTEWNKHAVRREWERWRNWNAPRVAYGRIQKRLTSRQ